MMNKRDGAAGDDLQARARALHEAAIVIDSHSDTTSKLGDPAWDFMKRHNTGHMDFPRIREGGLDALFLAIYMGEQNPAEPGISVKKALEQFDWIRSLPEKHPDQMELALTAPDIRRIAAAGKTALLIGVEGGHILDNSLEALRCFYRLGARYLTLTHAFHHDWADSGGFHWEMPPGKGGLTDFGRQVVGELNRLGMMVDISHVSDNTFRHALEVSRAPLVATHSGARALCNSPRNLSDEMIQALAERGGVLQVVFFPAFLDPDYEKKSEAAKKKRMPREEEIRAAFKEDPAGMEEALHRLKEEIPMEGTPLSMLIDHIEHVIGLVGPDHVGLGADWDGVWCLVDGVEDCSRVPAITQALLERGHSEEVVKKVLGENLLRLMDEVAEAAAALH